jgi:hypothetical protein
MAKLLYLKPTGSTCYTNGGVTFPKEIEINLRSVVQILGARDPRWIKQAENLPPVLTFFGDELTRRNINATMAGMRVEILCREFEEIN